MAAIKIFHRIKFHVDGRGDVYGCTLKDNPKLTHELITKLWKDQTPVEIDGGLFLIRAIERAYKPTALMALSDDFGLLVKKYKRIKNESNSNTSRHVIPGGR